jgi:hypothetical protein
MRSGAVVILVRPPAAEGITERSAVVPAVVFVIVPAVVVVVVVQIGRGTRGHIECLGPLNAGPLGFDRMSFISVGGLGFLENVDEVLALCIQKVVSARGRLRERPMVRSIVSDTEGGSFADRADNLPRVVDDSDDLGGRHLVVLRSVGVRG